MDWTRKTLGELLGSRDDIISRNAMSILKRLQAVATGKEQREFFEITSVGRDDLDEAGFDTSKVDDATMTRLASKMADAYCENGFWIDIEIIAESLGIPQKK